MWTSAVTLEVTSDLPAAVRTNWIWWSLPRFSADSVIAWVLQNTENEVPLNWASDGVHCLSLRSHCHLLQSYGGCPAIVSHSLRKRGCNLYSNRNVHSNKKTTISPYSRLVSRRLAVFPALQYAIQQERTPAEVTTSGDQPRIPFGNGLGGSIFRISRISNRHSSAFKCQSEQEQTVRV